MREDIYKICTQPSVDESAAIIVVEEYIKVRRNEDVTIAPPSKSFMKGHPIQEIRAAQHTQMLFQAYAVAKDFFLVLHDAPHKINVKIYS